MLKQIPIVLVKHSIAPFLEEENRDLAKILNIPDLIYINHDYKNLDKSVDIKKIKKLCNYDQNDELKTQEFKSLVSLKLDNNFNRPIPELSSLMKLTSLNLGIYFNQTIELKNLKNLTSLDLGWEFNRPIKLSSLITLTSLNLGYGFNRRIELSNLTNLTSLHLGHYFNQTINLTSLHLGIYFNQKIELKLTSLHLGRHFDQKIDYPINLKKLTIDNPDFFINKVPETYKYRIWGVVKII